jgi:CHAD domain-containing protein
VTGETKVRTYREVEDKYDVEAAFVLPSLAATAGVASVDEAHVDELVATYFDTPDYRLARHRITLRRRTGGADAGWHLKLPAGSERSEIHHALGRGERVPPRLGGLVYARTRGRKLIPIARLSTSRSTYTLRGVDGTALAELADDHVRAEVFAADGREVEVSAWREVEVELVAGNATMLEGIGGELHRAGARRSARPSKLAGVLGGRLAADPELRQATVEMDKRTAAGDVIQSYLIEQTELLISADLRVRLDEADSIHDMRVASRRIRSTLGTFRRLLDADRARDLEDRLRDLGAQLGEARDSEVLLERLLCALDDQPPTFVLGPVRRRVQEDLRGKYLQSRAAALAFMSTAVYAALLDDLIALVNNGFISGSGAGKPAGRVLPKLVRRRRRKLKRRVRTAQRGLEGGERDHALHEARKAAKQARYAAEAVTPALGGSAARFASWTKHIQEILGEHQDSVVAAAVLRRMAIASQGTPDESAFTFGLLAGLERAAVADTQGEFERAWSKVGTRGAFPR